MLLCATIETFVDAIPLLTELLNRVLSTVFREISLIMTTEDSAGNTDRPATMESDSRQSETISGTGRVAYTHRYTQVHTGTHRCTQVTPSGRSLSTFLTTIGDGPQHACTKHQSLAEMDVEINSVRFLHCRAHHCMRCSHCEIETDNTDGCSDGVLQTGRKEGNVLFNDALNTFYLWLYGIRHVVKDHSDSKRGNLLMPHGLLFSF